MCETDLDGIEGDNQTQHIAAHASSTRETLHDEHALEHMKAVRHKGE